MNDDAFKWNYEKLFGYEPPITMLMNDIEAKIESDCINVVQHYGFNVDKDELMKALNYDRDQYNKGYQDGVKKALSERSQDEWIPVSERLPNRNGVYNVTRRTEEGNCLTDSCYFDGTDTWHDDTRINHGRKYLNGQIISWMPLPEPYKEAKNE